MDEETRKEIERLILEERLKVTESRLHFLLAFAGAALTIFGILVPLVMTTSAANRVDGAITEMKTEFAKLVGGSARKADIAVLESNGEPILPGTVIDATQGKAPISFRIVNNGSAIASNVKVEFLVHGVTAAVREITLDYGPNELESVELEGADSQATRIFSYVGPVSRFLKDVTPILLHPQEEHHVRLQLIGPVPKAQNDGVKVRLPVTVRVYYGEPAYKEVNYQFEVWNLKKR